VRRRGTTHLENRFRYGILKDHDQLYRGGINAKGPEERQCSVNGKVWPFARK
jgi:hypothetical protein